MNDIFAIVSTYYDSVGGVSQYVKNIERYSVELGYNILVLSPDISKKSYGNKVKIKGKQRIVIILDLLANLIRHEPNAIQCHGVWYLLLPCILYKSIYKIRNKKNVKLIHFKHSDIYSVLSSGKRFIHSIMDYCSDVLCFPCSYFKTIYPKIMYISKNKRLEVVYPGRAPFEEDVKNIGLVSNERNSCNSYKPCLTYVGLFHYPEKVRGLYLLLECIAELRKDYPYIGLIIAGRGRFEDSVRKCVEEHGLSEHVTIFTDVSNPYGILMLSDLHCHITFQDIFPLVILEALSAGVPTVASDCGGIAEIRIQGLRVIKSERMNIIKSIAQSIENKDTVDMEQLYGTYNWVATCKKLYKIAYES